MTKNFIICILRSITSLGRTKIKDNDMSHSERLYYNEQIGEDLKIQVDEEIPDFIKNQDETEHILNTENIDKVLPKINTIAKKYSEISEGTLTGKDTSAVNPQRSVFKVNESLLDNKPLVKMFEESTCIIKNLERIRPAFESDDCQDLINTVREQLIQAMVLSGGKTIDNERQFDILRHKSLKGVRANEGDEIIKTLEPGVSLEERVFLKAIVEVKTNNDN